MNQDETKKPYIHILEKMSIVSYSVLNVKFLFPG